ncbi:MAG: uroporphyrinogen decarboxylase family protein [Armatimonadota bacterium]|nr:uroporphyrinogen decarboxylase family protein [Armatimonadota bacterium]
MDSRERILTTLKGGIPDRVGRQESLWSETLALWKTQGLEEGQDISELFGFDFHSLPWMDMSLRLPVEIYEETDEYVIQKDANGVTRKDVKRESGHTPHWIAHTVQTAKDWYEYKERLTPDDVRIPANIREVYEAGRAKKKFVHYAGIEAYECAWPVFGQVNIFMLMMDEPKVVADVFNTYTDLQIALAQKVLDMGLDFDGAWMYGDMGYRNSTLFSPECYEQLLWPAHKRMCDFFNSHGKPVILHSCGKIEALIPKLIEAGFAAIQPLEAKCGQDVRVLKELYGNKITFFGNIDIRKLSGTKADIEEEISSKVPIAMKGGGYIFHSDHSVPPTVSFDNYRYAIELLEKYGKY